MLSFLLLEKFPSSMDFSIKYGLMVAKGFNLSLESKSTFPVIRGNQDRLPHRKTELTMTIAEIVFMSWKNVFLKNTDKQNKKKQVTINT